MTLLEQACEDTRLTPEELAKKLLAGARCVRYLVCYSFLIGSIQVETKLRLYRTTKQQFLSVLPSWLVTLFFGWWALPWGPLLTVQAIWFNLEGGDDVTERVYTEFLERQKGMLS